MPDLRVSIVQSDLLWHQPAANRDMFEEHVRKLSGSTDLILLPEMFTSGFTMEVDGLEDIGSPTSDWMREQARLSGAALCGSTVYKTANGHVNRLLFASPDGDITHYDKTHLFRMAGEHERYVAGARRVVTEYMGWRILLLVCYDLRFPVFCRNRQDYDLVLCVANWPAARRHPWRVLLQSRAIENQAFVAGVNRVGEDGNGVAYSGDSMLVDFKGHALIDREPDEKFVATETLSLKALENFREKFQAWRDADEFSLPQYD